MRGASSSSTHSAHNCNTAFHFVYPMDVNFGLWGQLGRSETRKHFHGGVGPLKRRSLNLKNCNLRVTPWPLIARVRRGMASMF